MPLYEYECRECEERFEEITPLNPPPGHVRCPECGSPQVSKLLSLFATQRVPAGGRASCDTGSGFG